MEWFEKAAEQGNAEAQFHLGRCFFDGVGVGRASWAEAAAWWAKAASEGGHRESQYKLGWMHFNGFRDEKKTAEYVRPSSRFVFRRTFFASSLDFCQLKFVGSDGEPSFSHIVAHISSLMSTFNE